MNLVLLTNNKSSALHICATTCCLWEISGALQKQQIHILQPPSYDVWVMDSKPFKTKIPFRLPAGRLPYQSHARCSIGLLISHLWRIVCIEDWWSLPILPLIATHGRQTVNGQGRGVFLRITWWINTLHINLERHMIETIHQGTCHMMLSRAGVLRCAVGWTHSGRTLDRFRFCPPFLWSSNVGIH